MNVCSAPEKTHKQITALVLWICQQTHTHQSGPVMDHMEIDADIHAQVAQKHHVMVMVSAIQAFKVKVIARVTLLICSVPIAHSP